MSKGSTLAFTAEDLKELLSVLDAGPYAELELETERFKLTLKRGDDGGWTQESKNLDEAIAISGSYKSAISAGKTSDNSQTEEVVEGLINVPAPMVGIFYRAPKPGAPPFIEVGSKVQKDSIIAIIEVMKLMNSVRAGVAGEVVEILKENAESIEQGQTLIRVKPE